MIFVIKNPLEPINMPLKNELINYLKIQTTLKLDITVNTTKLIWTEIIQFQFMTSCQDNQ